MNEGNKNQVSGYLIEGTAKMLKQTFAKLLVKNEIGITVDQWIMIRVLENEDGITQLEIAKRAYKDPPTVTRIIDILEKKDIVERTPTIEDRRKYSIKLKDEGHRLAARIWPLVDEFRSKSFEGISKKELEELDHVMKKIQQNIN